MVSYELMSLCLSQGSFKIVFVVRCDLASYVVIELNSQNT
jgi:hypothetical protein